MLLLNGLHLKSLSDLLPDLSLIPPYKIELNLLWQNPTDTDTITSSAHKLDGQINSKHKLTVSRANKLDQSGEHSVWFSHITRVICVYSIRNLVKDGNHQLEGEAYIRWNVGEKLLDERTPKFIKFR
ncbi:hypothetical protein M9H77_06004 [Catharanthus roseus]|uniref:Uncharacterized protein n=1 Tax=Catharanthus roseus TaxID=4058 RepID=A0ACC0BR11_CATRO|nr:hypothetical protein M9H77_06004 [Catharanthus roseus]